MAPKLGPDAPDSSPCAPPGACQGEGDACRPCCKLSELARWVVVRGGAPTVAVSTARRRKGKWDIRHGAYGRGAPDTDDTATGPILFDLASLTKPFVATAWARACQADPAKLRAPLARWLPPVHASPAGQVSLELLLSHRSGLAAHRELYRALVERRPFDPRDALRQAASALRPGCEGPAPAAGWPPVYSDLGYILAGAAFAACTGLPLDRAVAQSVTEPLGLSLELGSARQLLALPAGQRGSFVVSEIVGWRGGEVVGQVHDENAWALAGHGLAGHAGLFGSAASVARFGAALLDARAGRCEQPWLTAGAARQMLVERPGGSLRMGFDGVNPEGSSAGRHCSTGTFGHLGFTGTSFWCDPEDETVVVLLANRVRYGRNSTRLRQLRPAAHEGLFDAARS